MKPRAMSMTKRKNQIHPLRLRSVKGNDKETQPRHKKNVNRQRQPGSSTHSYTPERENCPFRSMNNLLPDSTRRGQGREIPVSA